MDPIAGLQALRLVDEIMATQEGLDLQVLAESMDLDLGEVNELIDSVQSEWERMKEITCPINIDLADNDEFECTSCEYIFDIEDSIKVGDDLHCPDCSNKNSFNNRLDILKKCGIVKVTKRKSRRL